MRKTCSQGLSRKGRQMRIKEKRNEKGFLQIDVCRMLEDRGNLMDNALLSRIEHGHVMPTVRTFRLLCQILEAEPRELLDPADVDYGLKRKSGRNPESIYKLTARLDRELVGDLEAKVKACGWMSITEWLVFCIRCVNRRVERKSK